ncbi:hypothetical protein C8R45DRAFT_1095636 [Mycena sanguinolenta]|nr:hypothetical protein C8R45DRAFT_1095636 [Mycena sanguinolenta]
MLASSLDVIVFAAIKPPLIPSKIAQHDNALCSPEELHTEALRPKNSHNFESYQVHDSKSQRFYWIVLNGLKPGIYSLPSAAEAQLPLEGNFKLIWCQSIGEVVHYSRNWCNGNHIFTCDPAEHESARQKSIKERTKRGPDVVSDSDDELVFLTPLTRTITIIPGPGPDPEWRRPMCLVIFPLDEKAAQQLHLKADGTCMGPGESSGLNPATSSRRFSPSKRRCVPKQGSASPEPKVALFREDDDNSDNSARPIGSVNSTPSPTVVAIAASLLLASVTSASSLSFSSTSAPSSCATQSRPVLESASTARSTKQTAVGSGGPSTSTPKAPKGKFKPAVAASHEVAARLRAQAPPDGPFFFNPQMSTIYRKLLPGLCGMEGKDELKWIKTARAMQRVIAAGGVLVKEEEEDFEVIEDVFATLSSALPSATWSSTYSLLEEILTPNSLVPPIETLATEDSTENHELEEEDINLQPQSDSDEEGSEEPEWHGIVDVPQDNMAVAKKCIPHLANADDDEDVALPEVAGLTTWVKRNPGKLILCSKRGKRTIGPEQRRTLNDKAKLKKKCMAKLQADLLRHNQARTALVDELAVKHRFKPKLVKQQLTASTVFKKAQKPSLAKNEQLDLHELRKHAIDYPDFENMSCEFKDELLEGLEEHRLTKKTRTRATNKAVAQDASHVMKMLDHEIRNLFDRCGMYGFAIFSKGHVQDKTVPYILESAGCSDFIRECLKIEPMDLVAKFEQWCCSRDLGFMGVDTLQSMRKEVTRMVKDGLIMASKRTKCAMNYERYIKVVVLGYGVIIVGWPESIDFTSPTNISSVDNMRKLRDSWKDSRCRWKVLTESEKEKWK